MKNLFKLPLRGLGGLLLGLGLTSCSLFGDTSPDTLPPETQNGAETFGCLVNGKVFVPKGGGGEPAIVKVYDGRFAIVANRAANGDLTSQAGFIIEKVDKVGEYFFTKAGNVFYTGNSCSYGVTKNSISGKVIVTKYERGEDKANNLKWLIISGTFEGILPPERNCKDTLNITQGRFDVRF